MKKPSLLILATLALGGCGQKGPLYLPEHNEVVITSPVSPEATEAKPQPLPGEAPQSSQAPQAPAQGAPAQPQNQTGQSGQTGKQSSSSSSSPPAANPAPQAQPNPPPR